MIRRDGKLERGKEECYLYKEDGSLLEVIRLMLGAKDVLLFSSLTLIIFLVSTYFYNSKFLNHKYPEFFGILKYIAPVV